MSRDYDYFFSLNVKWRDAATSIHVGRELKIVFQDGMFIFSLTVIGMPLLVPTVVESIKQALLALRAICSESVTLHLTKIFCDSGPQRSPHSKFFQGSSKI